jgi:hypothetical protein
MKRMIVVVVVAAGLVAGSWIPAPAQYGGGPPGAQAQDNVPLKDKGVTAMNLVTSTGGFSARTDLPLVLTGQKIQIEPGGETARQRFLVPAFVYVLDGVLTTDSEAGATGVKGLQYYAGGQAVALPPTGTWLHFYNSGLEPVTFIVLFVGTPGATTTQKAAPAD